jgi:PTS system mannose-specific IIB component
MPIVLIRIDDRLVHGQIVEGWLKTISIDVLLVVSDLVAKNKMQQMLMSITLPSEVIFDVKTRRAAVDAILNKQYGKKKIMILVMQPSDALYMIEKGIDIKSINVGGMHFFEGKRQLLYNIFVDNKDVESLYKIHSKGIEIEGRILPDDERKNIAPIIEKEYLSIHEVRDE